MCHKDCQYFYVKEHLYTLFIEQFNDVYTQYIYVLETSKFTDNCSIIFQISKVQPWVLHHSDYFLKR